MAFKSLEVEPNKDSPGTIFIKSQFAKHPKLPNDIDLSGKVAIVTGASTGLGFHACLQLLSFRLSHFIPVRSVKKGEHAASKLCAQFPGVKIEAFVSKAERELTRLDVVILNDGIVKHEFGVVEETGHDEVLQVNYLSTVLLSIVILPILKMKSPSGIPGRLTIVGSGTALNAKFPNRHEVLLLKSFDRQENWDPNERYWCSKLLMHYFMAKLRYSSTQGTSLSKWLTQVFAKGRV